MMEKIEIQVKSLCYGNEKIEMLLNGERITFYASYMGQEPDTVELVTGGVLEDQGNAWFLSYEESDLTGMGGVTTTFIVEPDKVTLKRTGKHKGVIFVHTSICRLAKHKTQCLFFDSCTDRS